MAPSVQRLDVRYVDGRMEYTLRDAAFPGVRVRLLVLPLADSVGLVVKLRVEGVSQPGEIGVGPSDCATSAARTCRQCDDNVSAGKTAGSRSCGIALSSLRAAVRGRTGRALAIRRRYPRVPGRACALGAMVPRGEGQRKSPSELPCKRSASAKSPWKAGSSSAGAARSSPSWPIRVRRRQLARARSRSIAERITVHTPDPYLNQAMPMMALATDGIWGDAAILHGGWSWRQAYLGWRGWYGPLCYGWTDRVKRSIEQHCTLGLIREGPDKGALGSMLEWPNWRLLQHERGFHRPRPAVLRLHQRRRVDAEGFPGAQGNRRVGKPAFAAGQRRSFV